ncbi:MAG: hypothetical protein COA79_10840 [Planctomycetota bacterium]|nr:MAG: hypothetical protein COA79_10840 [Planctomycetota bacterium]
MGKLTKVDHGIQTLREAILEEKWTLTNGYISEKSLIDFLKLSKVSVRKCIACLQEENYLRSIPYKGYVVGPAAIQKIYERKYKGEYRRRVIFVIEMEKLTNYHYSAIVDAAKDEAKLLNFEFQVSDLDKESLVDEINRHPDVLTTIALLKTDLDFVDYLIQSCAPSISVEFVSDEAIIDSIVQDDGQGINLAFDSAWDKNHREIGLIVLGNHYFQPVRRYTAFTAALMRKNLLDLTYASTTKRFDPEGGKECVRKLYSNGKKPTAIIVSHLEMITGILDELELIGVIPGEDVSIIAWGNEFLKNKYLSYSKWEKLNIDLIQWSREEMGKMVIRMLEARIKNPLIPTMKVEVPVEYVDNGSVKTL